LVLKGADLGVKDGETGSGNSMGRSVEDERRCGGQATVSGRGDRLSTMGACSGVGDVERVVVMGGAK
jgi:hypothetical protein